MMPQAERSTEDLIATLARSAARKRAKRLRPARDLALAGAFILVFAALVVVALLGIRADLRSVALSLPVVVKVASAVALLAGAFVLAVRTARPEAGRVNALWILPGALTLVVGGALATVSAAGAAPPQGSVATCIAMIAALAALPLAATLIVLRRAATTQPALTGAAAGLFAGALSALAYVLHCPFDSGTAIVLGYGTGLGLTGLFGALVGRRLLAW